MKTNPNTVTNLSKHFNYVDTPDIASAVEAQKLEKIATADTTPLKILPDQAMTGQDSVFDAVARR